MQIDPISNVTLDLYREAIIKVSDLFLVGGIDFHVQNIVPGIIGATYRQNPVDWEIQYFPNAEQVHETPQDGGNEWCDHDKQKPVCASD